MSFFRDLFRPKSGSAKDARLEAEGGLVFDGIIRPAMDATKQIAACIPEATGAEFFQIYFEYICFLLHVTNRFAAKSGASWQEVDEMASTITDFSIRYAVQDMFESVPNIQGRPEKCVDLFYELVNNREKQYAESTEYASKEWKPLTGTSTVDMLVRNIREILDTYNPEVLFQIQHGIRASVVEARLPELVDNYRKTHPWPQR